MSELVHEFSITVEQQSDYEFRVRFDKAEHPELLLDEPAPLGKDKAPNASRILAAAIGNCLSASFLFAARKQGLSPGAIQTKVRMRIVRNEKRRLRIGEVDVELDPRLDGGDPEKIRAAAAVFEDFCTVTASVRQGIPTKVRVRGLE